LRLLSGGKRASPPEKRDSLPVNRQTGVTDKTLLLTWPKNGGFTSRELGHEREEITAIYLGC